MAAEALVSFLVEQLATSVLDEVKNEVGLVASVQQEVENITKDFKAILAVLNDAEQRQIKEELVKDWLEDLKDVAYEMEDVIDEWRTSILVNKSQQQQLDHGDHHHRKRNKVLSILRSPVSTFHQLALRRNIGSRIKQLKQQLGSINSRKSTYHLVERNTPKVIHGDERQTSSVVDLTNLYGRDADKDIIVNLLLGESDTSSSNSQQVDGMSGSVHPIPNPLIISIVGMGGLGKTTLAQFAFNNPQVKTHFNNKIVWFCVSHPFDRKKLAQVIIHKFEGPNPKTSEWEDLHTSLCESVKGNRFLLVLDDVWPHDQDKWDSLMLSFKLGAPGSRILVTTRNENVAKRMGAIHVYQLQTLSDDDCWSLVRNVAFGKRAMEADKKALEEIGIEIAKKCKGLPLAAKFLGGLLSEKRTKNEWEIVLNNEIWELEQQGDSMYYLTPSLLLSYFELSPPVKRCFTYCAIFPKDTVIEKNELILLWMAQGLLIPKWNDGEFERLGGEYFEKLTMRSFFQDLYEYDDDGIVVCKMHDLVHDFAKFLTAEDCLTISSSNCEELLKNSARIRHLTFEICNDEKVSSSSYSSIYKVKNLRTLHFLKSGWKSYSTELPSDLCCRLRCLRVLQLHHIGLCSLPSEIKKLIHLRYLDLSVNWDLRELPESICSLYNLQTLNLYYCSKLSNLPRGIGKLINLRHLKIQKTDNLKCFPEGIGKLTYLRTLDKFIFGRGCHVQELKGLNLLEGRIEISGLGSQKVVNEACKAVLKEKKHLSALVLSFGPNNDEVTDYSQGETELSVVETEGVLEELQPHRNLKVLYITDYPGFKFPDWMSEKSLLCQLHKLELKNCMNCTELPALGNLSSLEVLIIRKFPKVKKIGAEFYGLCGGLADKVAFPKLTELHIENLESLEEWDLVVRGEETIIIMPCLRKVEIRKTGKLKVLPAFGRLPSLENLVISGAREVERIGSEFYGICGVGGVNISFPKLTLLVLSDMDKLEEWGLGEEEKDKWNRGEIDIMPCLREILTQDIGKLKALPAFGRLPSLEVLEIDGAREVERIGSEFYGIGGVGAIKIGFPKLTSLELIEMPKLEEWELGEEEKDKWNRGELVIMPHLRKIVLSSNRLSTVSSLARLPCLEELRIGSLNEVRQMGPQFLYGLLGDSDNKVIFPQLTTLRFHDMNNMEELVMMSEGHQQIIMPRLSTLDLSNCPNLKVALPTSSPSDSLSYHHLIEELGLRYDCGDFSRSLPLLPNLKSLHIQYPPESTAKHLLESSLSQLKQLQHLEIRNSNSIECMPKEMQNLTNLQQLNIYYCETLGARCEKDEGEDWSIISHIPYIEIDFNKIQ